MPLKDQSPLIIGPDDAGKRMAQSVLNMVNDMCAVYPGLNEEIKNGFTVVLVLKSGRQIIINGQNAGPDPSRIFKQIQPGGLPPIPPLIR